MAHIWIRPGAEEWQPVALAGDLCVLTSAGLSSAAAAHAQADESLCVDPAATTAKDTANAIGLRRVANSTDDTWALLAGPLARPLVNGLPVPLGLVVLADRDEVRWQAPLDLVGPPLGPIFFSTEQLAAIVPYPADHRRGACPRCKQALTAGDAAVRCPGCGLWHHATDALPCWTYGELCAACPQPTSLDTGFQWTPEDL